MNKKTWFLPALVSLFLLCAVISVSADSLSFLPIGLNASSTTQAYGKLPICQGNTFILWYIIIPVPR